MHYTDEKKGTEYRKWCKKLHKLYSGETFLDVKKCIEDGFQMLWILTE